MSAPTSLLVTGREHASLKTSTAEFAASKSGKHSKEGVSQTQANMDAELIKSVFSQLATRALEDFKQPQYSQALFKALDDILKEPPRSLSRNNSLSFRLKCNKYRTTRRQSKEGGPSGEQPRSLPAESSYPVKPLQHQQKVSPKTHRPLVQANQDGLTLAPNGHGGFVNRSPSTENSPRSQPSSLHHQQQVMRSATTGDVLSRWQQQVPKNLPEDAQYLLHKQQQQQPQQTKNAPIYRANAKGYSANCNGFARPAKQEEYSSNFNQDDEDDEDDEDDDDDGDDDEDEEDLYISPDEEHRDQIHHFYQLRQKFNPITKSKTVGDTTGISERGAASQQKVQARHQASLPLQQKQHSNPRLRQHPHSNPIVRSNTISSASQNIDRERYNMYQKSTEPKSMVLSSKDIGSLYKPHMNYSKNDLGTHRLSDDDEIIIIPTQSPSLMSTSPDAGEANGEEVTERFSISRTKSFWERLANGNHGKRTTKSAPTNSDANSSPVKVAQSQQAGNKVVGARVNGHSHMLDHMDSTGGSNSNYSCSSSGDENGGSNSQHNPTIGQMHEMNRTNRFRQTR